MKLNIKERIKKSVSGEEHRRNLRHGSYSFVVTLIVIAVIVAVNLVVGQLPTSATQIDASSQKLYSIGDETKEFVGSLEEDVQLYYIVTSGNEDSLVSKMLERYQDLSSHLTVETIDPDLHPEFTAQYTDEEVSDNSVIVVSGSKNRIVSYSDMYPSSYYSSSSEFDGEGQLTSAISYVTSDETLTVYQLTGHEEQSLGSNFTDAIEKNNISLEDLSLVTMDSVPEDAAALIINAPAKDFSSEETDKLINYMENGGKILLFTNYTADEMVNLDRFLENYGLERDNGIVMEEDADHYVPQRPDGILPELNTSSEFASGMSSDSYVLMQDAQAIRKIDSYRDSLEITPILSTTDSGYIKQVEDGMISFEKNSEDETGSFDVGVSVSENMGNEVTAELVYFSSSTLNNDSYDELVMNGNSELLTKVITGLCNIDESESISIPVKSLSVSYLSYTQQSAAFWRTVIMIIIPAAFLAAGFCIWIRRRRR